jgi:hypothetical protein
MESNWASEHLQVIRTLMERSALYRRALAPVMIFSGLLGTLAAAVGILARIVSPPLFIAYWMVIGLVAVAGCFMLARRQALKDAEPFWSPPTRRVAQALLPALFFGCVFGIVLLFRSRSESPGQPGLAGLSVRWLPLLWIALYGCALHAAGFFMPRGIKIFGWALVLSSSAFCLSGLPDFTSGYLFGHGIMGLFFGIAHLAYGVYLYFTEPRRNGM